MLELSDKIIKVFLMLNESSYNYNYIDNQGIIGDVSGGEVTIKNGHERVLTVQERDLLRIYNKSNGKQQMCIMNFVYGIEDDINGNTM